MEYTLHHLSAVIEKHPAAVSIIIFIITSVPYIIAFLFKKKIKESSTITNQNLVQVDVKTFEEKEGSFFTGGARRNAYDIPLLKSKAKILFIEDDNFKKIQNLKKTGWNVIQLKSLDDLDNISVRSADVIFVDYKGIGLKSEDQGIGLLKALRARYKDEKWLIFYSAHKISLDVYNIGANAYLSKNSSVYEMEQKIIEGLRIIIK